MGTTGVRTRRDKPAARGRNSSPRGRGDERPANGTTGGAFELFSLDSITGGGSKKIGERYYQVEAVAAICKGLADGGRGQLRAACGTGKTVMAQRSAELLCADGGLVVILCPSIALVAQTLREWELTTENYIALAVCSDDTVRDAVITVDDIPAAVTTNVEEVADWLNVETAKAPLRLIVGTHASAHVVGEALRSIGRSADLLIVDEAHRTAGIVHKHTALVHNDARFPALRRLYATATPKVVGERARNSRKAFTARVVGMDDHTVFGKVLYEYTFAQAIADGYLDDYQLVVMGVTRAEIIEHLAGLPAAATGGKLHTSLHTAMVQTVLAKAARQYGFRRALTFCRRLNEARDFARTMSATLSALPSEMKPDRHLSTGFVDGSMTTTEREKRLQLLKKPPADGWSVVTNVKCLSEGVDVPAIDAVAFTHPKQSVSEIVQAIGRALRHDPNGSGMATILVPILLPDDADAGDDLDEVNVRDYQLLWQVVKALRAHDEKLGAPLDHEHEPTPGTYTYEEQPLEHVIINLPDGYDDGTFLQQLTAKIVTITRTSWWASYAALKGYYEQHNTTIVPRDYVVTDDVTGETIKLAAWTNAARSAYRRGTLAPDKVEALKQIEFDFRPDAVSWSEGIDAATSFFEQHGHLEPVRTERSNGIELRPWLDAQRNQAAKGDLADDRRAALNALNMRWLPRPKTFDEHIAALTAYRAQHGHIDIEPQPGTDDGYLGNWLIKIRIQRKMGNLAQAEIDALDALGMRWGRRDAGEPAAAKPTTAKPTTAKPPAAATRSQRATQPAPKTTQRAAPPPSPAATPRARVQPPSQTLQRGTASIAPPTEQVIQFREEPRTAAAATKSGSAAGAKPPVPVFHAPQN